MPECEAGRPKKTDVQSIYLGEKRKEKFALMNVLKGDHLQIKDCRGHCHPRPRVKMHASASKQLATERI